MIILGLIILIAAVVVAVAGVLGNRGIDHALVHQFAVFGYHVTGSDGRLFLYGIAVGAIGVAGLSLLLAAARRTSRRGIAARRGLRQSRQETADVTQDRDNLVSQRETARSSTVVTSANGTPLRDSRADPDDRRPRLLGRPFAPRHAATESQERRDDQVVPDAPIDTSAP